MRHHLTQRGRILLGGGEVKGWGEGKIKSKKWEEQKLIRAPTMPTTPKKMKNGSGEVRKSEKKRRD